MKNKSLRKPEIRVRSMALAVAACFVTANSMALPVGPQVVNGTATISQVGNTLNVTNSNGAILNWQSFNIGANETTRFIQPSASSAVLNRVLAQDPSVILGNLTSNGKVWLINPAGILVGPGARIDTAAFVASTLNITNADFLANRMRFDTGSGQAGNVVNQGTITTPLGGSVYLVGANVSNDGLITTPKGETILAAGNTVELIDSATPGVKVEITGTQGNATNLGEIVAQAGRIGIAGVIVRNSGQLNASSVVEDGGKIFLRASKDAYVDGAGRIVTTGKVGGQVEVLGERVAVLDQASIDASGEDGGGKVLVGGDWQGKNPDVRNAQISYFGPEAEIKVNATKVGAGGTAVVWADDTTRAYGRIEAKGVTRGGEVETSGKRYLDVAGVRVDTSASSGTTGVWLLDPDEIQVYAGNGADQLVNGASWNNGVSGYLQAVGGYGTSVIYGATIGANLATSNVNLVTSPGGYGGTGNITFNSGTYDYSAYGNNLSLFAYGGGSYSGNISFNNAILKLGTTAGGNGSAPDANRQVNLFAGWTGSGQYVNIGYGSISLANNSRIEAKKVYALAGNNIAIEYGSGIHGIYGSPDVVSLQSYGHIDLHGGIKSYGGDVLLWASSGVTIGNGSSSGGVGINARRDGLDGNTQTADEAGNGGRILIQADQDANGYGSFVLNYGGMVATTNQSHLIDSNGVPGSSGAMAIGIIAADVSISYGGTIKLNGNATATAGAPYGGGDIGFLSTYGSTIRVGEYFGSGFILDNTELARIFMPAAGASNCGTGQEGCRIWIGNISAPSDPLVGALPVTSQNIIVDRADFTKNGTTTVPKRVHLSTTGTVDDAGIGGYGGEGSFGIKAGHISVYGGAGIGKADSDGLSFIANSANLMSGFNSAASTIKATSIGIGELALRRATAHGDIDIKALYGGVTLLPYFAGQREATYGSFSLSASGDIRVAAYGNSYTVYGAHSTFTETSPSSASIRAGGSINLHSSGGSVAIAGDHAAQTGMSIFGYGGIAITDGGLASGGNLGLTTYGDLTLTGVDRGVFVMSSGAMNISADNVYATGGSGINAAGKTVFADVAGREMNIGGYGAGVSLAAYGDQVVNATGGVIQLQAGSANNANYGGPNDYDTGRYGGSVVFKSNANQTILAQQLRAYGGVTGHDNLVMIGAYGDQTITLGSYGGSASLLYLKGGDAVGSYNNLVGIEQQGSAGNQSITLYGAGANLTLQAGNGTGTLGRTDSECALISGGCPSGSSNNSVQIQSRGNSMEIDLYQGGSVSLTGGSGGYRNHASIEFNSNSSYGLWIGSDGGQNFLPSISLQGGTGGMYYGANPNDAWLSNGAEITAGNDYGGVTAAGVLSIDASSISLTGGAGALAPAIISATTTNILVYGGDLTLTGGTGTASGAPAMATGAVIGNDTATSVTITTYGAGSDVRMVGGSGAYGAVMIGSLYGAADVAINAAGVVTGTGNTGGVFVGSMTSAAGSDVRLIAGSGSNVDFDTAARIGATTLTAEGAGISMRGLNAVTGQIGLTSYGSGAVGNIEFNLGGGSLGAVSTTTDLASSQIIKFSGNVLSLAGSIDMEGDSLQLYATSGNIIFGSGGSLSNVKDVVLNSYGGIYNNNTNLTVANIDVSTYGGSVVLTGTELGLPYSYATDVGSPITLKLGGASTVQATATSGGTNLLQTQGTLFTSKYTLSNQAGNHVHLQAPAGIVVDSTLNQTGRSLVLASSAGSVSQGVAAPITADLLAVTSYGGIDLYASNSVGMLSASNSTLGNVRFKNSSALAVTDNYNYNNGFGVRNWTPNNGSSDGGVEITVAGNLTLAGGVQAYGPIILHAAGNLIQGGGGITNSYGIGTNDISIYGADITLTDVSSQRHIVLTASGNVSLVSPYYGYVDDSYFLYNLPFAFNFYGTSYTQAYITSNGLITFGVGTSNYSDSISGLGSYRAIAPAWNDWIQRTSTGRDIFIKQPSSNSLAVQWNAARYSNESKTANFEAVLYNSGNIQFNYGVANDSFSGDVTIGLSNGTTALASQLMSVSNFSLNNLVSTTFTPTAGGYQETVSGSAVALTNTSGATTGAMQMSGGYGNDTALHAIGNVTALAGGTFTGYSGIDASLLTVTSTGGFNLSGYSYLDSIALTNNGSGSLTLSNNHAAPLTINSISNAGTGAILVDNYGAVVVNGAVSGGGDVTINAHSPITVNSGASISGGGLVTLAALSSGPYSTTDLLSIAGSITSTGGNIALSGGSGVAVSALASLSVSGGKAISAISTYGQVAVDPGTTINGSLTTSSSTPTPTPTVTQVTTATITTATETAANSLSGTTTTAPPPPPASTGSTTSGSGGLLMPSAGGTIGGTEGSFGSSSASTTSSTSSSQTADSSGSSSTSSANGQQDSSQESKSEQKAEEKKGEKKEEKKDDKKKAEEKSEGKKDEKAASKKVSQCT